MSRDRPRGASRSERPSIPAPLSPGNVVTMAVQIYRSHFKAYTRLGLVGTLWGLVPFYGWAKANGIQAALSRLAFGELIDQPETVAQARRATDLRMWNVFVANLLIGLIMGGLLTAWSILFCVFALVGLVAGAATGSSTLTGVLVVILVIGSLIALLFGLVWFWSRLIVVELPIAVEESADPTRAIQRSWNLAQGSILQIQTIILLASLIAGIAWVPVQAVSLALQVGLTMNNDSPSALALMWVVVLLLSVLTGALMMPFWQVLKAVLYFNLRVRREGFGLKLRDRPELL